MFHFYDLLVFGVLRLCSAGITASNFKTVISNISNGSFSLTYLK